MGHGEYAKVGTTATRLNTIPSARLRTIRPFMRATMIAALTRVL
jgi:hypothetical protein